MSVARISRLDRPQERIKELWDSVHVKAVSVRRQLRRDPDRQPEERLRQRFSQPEGTFEVREAHFDLLAHRRAAARASVESRTPDSASRRPSASLR